MFKRVLPLMICIATGSVMGQMTPWLYWTFLPKSQMDEIIGEASGETAWNTIMETGGYNKDRLHDEYTSNFYETQYIYDQLKRYGLPGAEIVRFPGGDVWDGIKGELWEIDPYRQKLASYKDMTAMLANGSSSADVKTELVWIGRGTEKEMENLDISGKIVVTEGSMGNVHRLACLEKGAAGVVAISQSRPYFDPLQIPWSGLRSWRETSGEKPRFGFFLPVREGDFLKQRLLRGEKITVHAQVESRMESFESQDVVCHIPGTDPDAGEIIFTAHLFEGIVKQGANDNKSGSAGILEVARVLHTLIEDGRLPRPRRTIRFLWGPEISGTGQWLAANKEIMDQTLCNINMDMVGEWLSKNQAFMCLMRTTYANPHYINDVMENYYRFVGEGNRARIQNRSTGYPVPHRIVAPTGADEPFYYAIETHFGASDHEMFNDWSVGVPGVMMIAWPDQWFHTSGDRVDKADPTQMKRVAVIGAAAAYTIASADDAMAIRIAAEIASNGARRLGHQYMVGLETLNGAEASHLNEAYRMARLHVETAVENEKATLESVMELADDRNAVGSYIAEMKKNIHQSAKTHLQALEIHMKVTAKQLGVTPRRIPLTDPEKKASKIIPRRTAKVRAKGYLGFRGLYTLLQEIPESAREKYAYDSRNIGSTSELQALINGVRSVLDIKHMLDVQYSRKSDVKAILNYLEILKLAGMVEW